MSVLIPGMAMPTTGLYFVSVDNTGGRDKTVVTVERMLGNRDVRQIVGSFELIPVPPHGRLIDADTLRQSIKESIDECHKWADEVESGEMYARVSQSLGTFVECSLRVKAAPTIIPAEEHSPVYESIKRGLE